MKETSRKAASGLRANLCQGFHFRTFKRCQRGSGNKRQEEAGAERGRDEEREKAGEQRIRRIKSKLVKSGDGEVPTMGQWAKNTTAVA